MSVDKIRTKILSDARAEVGRIEAEIAGKVQEIEARGREQIEAIEREGREEAQRRSQDRLRKDIATAELELRKALLAQKQALIQRIFDRALARMIKLKGEEYQRFLYDLLLKTVETGDEEVIFSAGDELKQREKLLAEANRRLADEGKKGQLQLGKQDRDFRGGFILRKGKKEINCSMDALFNTVRDELEPSVAKILFSQSS
jgi:V/A-type H+-transporting ATPase subunit E